MSREDDEDNQIDEDMDCKSDFEGENITDSEIEVTRRDILNEINDLEWEFKQAKEALYNERIIQIDNKLQQFRSFDVPELKNLFDLVDEAYKSRRQVAKHQRDFQLEIANKELDNALQMATCDAKQNLHYTEERIRTRLQESICTLQIERSLPKLQAEKTKIKDLLSDSRVPSKGRLKPVNYGFSRGQQNFSETALNSQGGLSEDDNEYLPGQDLGARRKPLLLSPSAPRLIYELQEDEIQTDVQAIMNAVKEHKIAIAMVQMNSRKQ